MQRSVRRISVLCRSRRELSHECLVFTCKIWLRYSRERAVRNFLISPTNHPHGSQIPPCALHAVERAVIEFIADVAAAIRTSDKSPRSAKGGGSVKIELEMKSKIKCISGIIMMKIKLKSRNFEKLQCFPHFRKNLKF